MELLFVVLCLFGRRQRKRKVVEGEKESLKEFPAKRFRILMVEMVVSPCQQEKKKWSEEGGIQLQQSSLVNYLLNLPH